MTAVIETAAVALSPVAQEHLARLMELRDEYVRLASDGRFIDAAGREWSRVPMDWRMTLLLVAGIGMDVAHLDVLAGGEWREMPDAERQAVRVAKRYIGALSALAARVCAMAIPRKLPNKSLNDWSQNRPTGQMANHHMERVIRCAPVGWQAAIRARLGTNAAPILAAAQMHADGPPEWVQAWDMLQAVADYEDRFGGASLWNLADYEICALAKKLAAEADELDALAIGNGDDLAARVQSIRMLVRCAGITEDKPIEGLPSTLRAQHAAWWRRRLRVHVARVVEAGAVGLGLVHKGRGGYVSRDGLERRQQQLKRNAEALGRTLYRNEAGQVFTLRELAELAELGTANPIIRGGELMTRIRGAEEHADSRAHVGLFLTLTLPSRFHPVKLGSGGRPIPNKKHRRATPRDGRLWLRGMWAKTRAALACADLGRRRIQRAGHRSRSAQILAQ